MFIPARELQAATCALKNCPSVVVRVVIESDTGAGGGDERPGGGRAPMCLCTRAVLPPGGQSRRALQR